MDLLESTMESPGWNEIASPLAGAESTAADDAANIRWIQNALNQAAQASLAVDGNAGPRTRAAIRAFQSANGLAADGIAGPRTLAALHAAVDRGATPAAHPVACTGLPERQVLDRFAFGQHRLEPHHQPQIDMIAACLLASLASPTPIDGLSLVGHTDPVGTDDANIRLGQQRAEAVVEGIDASLRRQAAGRHFAFVFMPSSMGETAPVAGDAALSRRVEIIAPFAFPRPAPPRPRPRPRPPFRSELDPPRWGPILARAISPRAVLRTGNAVRHLIDAENPASAGLAGYAAMVEAIRAARGGESFIYLLGWLCIDDFDMVTCDPTSQLRRLLADAAARGVQIRALFWLQSLILAAEDRAKTQASADRINALPGGAAIIDSETLTLGSHHQKVLVVGGPEGSLVGFTGGLDVNSDRVLPSTIVCTPPVRPGGESADDFESMSGGGGQPLHDVHCRMEGPAAFDLLRTFVTRWDHHPDSGRIEAVSPLRGRTVNPPAAIAQPTPATSSSTGGTCSVVVGRTFNPRRGSGLPRERDIKTMLVTAISRARRFIYMEDQYLINLDAARALRAALPNIQHLTILIAATDVNSDTPCFWTYRREFAEALTGGLSPELRAKVRLFQLVTPPLPPVVPPCSNRRTFMPTFGRHTYVHAKCWIFDDELAVIGSANCNRRGWEHDSEIGAFIFDDRIPTDPATRTFAQQLRMDLWSEHLGLPAAGLLDGVASGARWLRPPAGARVLRYCPEDGHDFADFRCGALRETLVDPSAP
jgi:phosphatidylserine/phosphatidylglycerophosphate/cardiolipin synthase-like enzyme/outer membrane protein OmpA-like peptidoglycan-associated protein